MSKEKNEHTPPLGSSAIQILTAAFFILLIAVVIVWNISKRISFILTGIIFLGITGVIIANKVKITLKTFPMLLCPIAGLLMTVIPIYSILSEKNPERFPDIDDGIQMYLIAIGFALLGICIAAYSTMFHIHLKKHCTCETTATCILIDRMTYRGSTRYAPKWKYYFDGNKYTHQDSNYVSRCKVSVGDETTILVNPDDPTEILRPGSWEYLAAAFIGLIMTVPCVIILCVM